VAYYTTGLTEKSLLDADYADYANYADYAEPRVE
jgi:hypothetical protein